MLHTIKRILGIVLVAALALATVAYLGDYAIFRLRSATNRSPYGSVTVTHYYAVLQKNGRTEFIFNPPGPQTCVHTLFPHTGLLPCWYLARHPEQRTDI